MKRILFQLLVVALIGGCASGPVYVPPESGDVAFLTGVLHQHGLANWDKFEVKAIDDLFIEAGGVTFHMKIAVAPGERRILVQGTFNRTIGGGGPYMAFIPVRFEFRPKVEYRLNGLVRDNLMQVWVEEQPAGQKASGVFSAPFGTTPAAPPVPIFIPVR